MYIRKMATIKAKERCDRRNFINKIFQFFTLPYFLFHNIPNKSNLINNIINLKSDIKIQHMK